MFHSTTYFPVHIIELHAKVLGTNTTCFNNNTCIHIFNLLVVTSMLDTLTIFFTGFRLSLRLHKRDRRNWLDNIEVRAMSTGFVFSLEREFLIPYHIYTWTILKNSGAVVAFVSLLAHNRTWSDDKHTISLLEVNCLA